jgi:hypothetical protein
MTVPLIETEVYYLWCIYIQEKAVFISDIFFPGNDISLRCNGPFSLGVTNIPPRIGSLGFLQIEPVIPWLSVY